VGRISGPLLDRIDIHIDVPAVKFRELTGETPPETDSSTTIRNRVIVARETQLRRFAGEKIFANAAMTPRMIRRHCRIDSASEQMLEQAMTRVGLSARAYDRILKVSRTIADLEGCEKIASTHVSEESAIGRWIEPIGRDAEDKYPPTGETATITDCMFGFAQKSTFDSLREDWR
jgi:magnesium chelatase family protein